MKTDSCPIIICPDCQRNHGHKNVGLMWDIPTGKLVGEFLNCSNCSCTFSYSYADRSTKATVAFKEQMSFCDSLNSKIIK